MKRYMKTIKKYNYRNDIGLPLSGKEYLKSLKLLKKTGRKYVMLTNYDIVPIRLIEEHIRKEGCK